MASLFLTSEDIHGTTYNAHLGVGVNKR